MIRGLLWQWRGWVWGGVITYYDVVDGYTCHSNIPEVSGLVRRVSISNPPAERVGRPVRVGNPVAVRLNP